MTAVILLIYAGGISAARDRGRGVLDSLCWPWDLGVYLFELSMPKD